jgi:hypothetical protein
VIVLGVQKNQISFTYDVGAVIAQHPPFAFAYEADHVIVMEVVREFLHNSLKVIGFNIQIGVICYISDLFLLHANMYSIFL